MFMNEEWEPAGLKQDFPFVISHISHDFSFFIFHLPNRSRLAAFRAVRLRLASPYRVILFLHEATPRAVRGAASDLISFSERLSLSARKRQAARSITP
jgi:hypothetical protein